MRGTIKNWKAERGFGFIQREGEDDVFCHIRDLSESFGDAPPRGTPVEFELGEGRDGRPVAKNVRPVI
jgi:cold shock CspA family protein